jgi:hypothetical protein
MNKFLIAGILATSAFATSAQAQHNHHNHHNRHWSHHHGHKGPVVIRESGGWIAPLIGGVIVGSIIADANKREQEKQVVVVQQPQTVVVNPAETCTAWKEIQTSDGTTYRERTCYPVR